MALVQYLARLDPDEQEVNARQYLARARKRLRRIEDGVAPANDASYARALAACVLDRGVHYNGRPFPSVDNAMTARIHIAAALLLNAEGKTLLVRKRGTGAFMQPGGKIEAGERPEDALGRELKEELDIDADIARARFLGRFSAPAANEPGFEVCCELYEILVDAAVVPAAEIEEAVWVDADSATVRELAPLTRDHVLPLYRQRLAERLGLDTVE